MSKEITVAGTLILVIVAFIVNLVIDEIMDAKSYLKDIPAGKVHILKSYRDSMAEMQRKIGTMTWEEYREWQREKLYRDEKILKYAIEVIETLEKMGQVNK